MANSPVKRSLEKEENSKSPKKIKLCLDSKVGEEERSFCELYEKIIDEFMKGEKLTDEDITSALFDIRGSFCYEDGKRFEDNNYNEVKYACGYLYRYAPYSAGLARLSTINVFEECDEFKNRITEKKDLKIVSLGGGPGSDMVGFASAMYDVLEHDDLINGYTFDICIVDYIKRWASCIKLAEYFLLEKDFGEASKLYKSKCCLNVSFLEHDLNESSPKYEETLKQADVILLTRFMSILNWRRKKEFAKNLRRNMEKDALLLYIDTTFDKEEDIWKENGFEIFYQSQEPLEKPYKVSLVRERFKDSGKFTPKSHFIVIMRVKS